MKEACGLGNVVVSTPDFQGLEHDSEPTYQNTRHRRFRKAWAWGVLSYQIEARGLLYMGSLGQLQKPLSLAVIICRTGV